MRNCKRCKKPFEARPAPNGIRPNKCTACLYALQREKQQLYRKRSEERASRPKSEQEMTLPLMLKLADDVFSIYIRLRDRGRCFTCGDIRRWQDQQNGHYIPRANKPTRFDERNNNCQCRDCNEFKSGSLPIYKQLLIEKYGEATVEELHRLKHQEKHFTIQELQELITTYKAKIKLYEPART